MEMKEITWTNDLTVGIELIDEQHKMLIKHLNDLSQALQSQQGPAKVAATLNFLIDYTNFHFTAEEKHMEANGYPELKNHIKKQHLPKSLRLHPTGPISVEHGLNKEKQKALLRRSEW